MATMFLYLTKQRNSSEGRMSKKERSTRTGLKSRRLGSWAPAGIGSGTHPSKAFERSWDTKLEDLSSKYMLFGLVHLTVFWCTDKLVASLGDDQFSLGATAPPRACISSL